MKSNGIDEENLKLELIKDLIAKISDKKLTYNQLIIALATQLVEYQLYLKPIPLYEQINRENIIYSSMSKVMASKHGKEYANRRHLKNKKLYADMKENIWRELESGSKKSNNEFASLLINKRFKGKTSLTSIPNLSRKVSTWRKEYESKSM